MITMGIGSTVYRVYVPEKGLYVRKNPGSGWRLDEEGTVWKRMGDLKCSITQGILAEVLRQYPNAGVLEYDVTEVWSDSVSLADVGARDPLR